MQITLEQQLAEIVRKHGLVSLSINATDHSHRDGVSFYCYAQGSKDDGERFCGSTRAEDMPIAEAIASAISDLNAKRYPVEVAPVAPMAEHRTNPHTGQPYTVLPPSDIPADRHECEACEDSGIIWNNADPTSGQRVDCDQCETAAETEFL